MKILVVDDDELNIEILNDILEDADFDTVSAENGQEALDIINKDSSIDIILLDRMMPVMNGMQFIEAFQKHPRWRDIPVIFQTAASRPAELIEGMETGAYYYLTKPFDRDIVLSIVRSAVDDLEKKRQRNAS